jgi:hypothetical protein
LFARDTPFVYRVEQPLYPLVIFCDWRPPL